MEDQKLVTDQDKILVGEIEPTIMDTLESPPIIKKWPWVSIGVFATIAYLLVFGMYFYFFGEAPIVARNELWGQFGDFVGGVLNPLFALLAFGALLYTIILTHEELGLTRNELKLTRTELSKTAKAATKQASHFEREGKKNDLMKVIEQIYSDILFILKKEFLPHQPTSEPMPDIRGELLRGSTPISTIFPVSSTLEKILNSEDDNLKKRFIPADSGNTPCIRACEQLAELLTSLSIYVCLYEKEAGNRIVSEFYKRKFYEVACELDREEYFEEENPPELFGL